MTQDQPPARNSTGLTGAVFESQSRPAEPPKTSPPTPQSGARIPVAVDLGEAPVAAAGADADAETISVDEEKYAGGGVPVPTVETGPPDQPEELPSIDDIAGALKVITANQDGGGHAFRTAKSKVAGAQKPLKAAGAGGVAYSVRLLSEIKGVAAGQVRLEEILRGLVAASERVEAGLLCDRENRESHEGGYFSRFAEWVGRNLRPSATGGASGNQERAAATLNQSWYQSIKNAVATAADYAWNLRTQKAQKLLKASVQQYKLTIQETGFRRFWGRDKALTRIRMAARLCPRTPYILAELASQYASHGNDGKAERIARKALTYNPNNYCRPLLEDLVVGCRARQDKPRLDGYKTFEEWHPPIRYNTYRIETIIPKTAG